MQSPRFTSRVASGGDSQSGKPKTVHAQLQDGATLEDGAELATEGVRVPPSGA